MGNHEFCSRCHASDFHSGMTCEQAYPEKLAQTQKETAQRERDRLKARAACVKLVADLRRKNIPAELEEHKLEHEDGWSFPEVVIKGYNMYGNRRKAMSWTNPNRRRSLKEYDNF